MPSSHLASSLRANAPSGRYRHTSPKLSIAHVQHASRATQWLDVPLPTLAEVRCLSHTLAHAPHQQVFGPL
eukprot:2013426-Amphidinium_carterae.1